MKILVHLFTNSEQKTYQAVEILRMLYKFGVEITLVSDADREGLHPDCYDHIVPFGHDFSGEKFDLALTIS